MNVLLVDDDYFVVTALESKIDWKALAIEQIHTAYNVSQAKEILQQHPVDILICDIEMPQGSGLELLAWIREERYRVQAIFLTNYADFNYAQKAIELQSFDYFLKPIEFDKLALIIRKAANKASEEQSIEEAAREGLLWKKNQNRLLELFWRKLITGKSFPSEPQAIQRVIEEQHLTYRLSDRFMPLLIKVFPYDGSLGKDDKDLFDYALLNVLNELLRNPLYKVETILEYMENHWIVILQWSAEPAADHIEGTCASLISKANRFLKCDVYCHLGLTASLAAVHPMIRQLIHVNEEMINSRNQIFHLDQRPVDEAVYVPPNLGLLETLLSEGDASAFCAETRRYLHELTKHQTLNVSALRLFRLDLMQMVYSFLKQREIQAHKLYAGSTNDQLFMLSLQSIEDMELYIAYLVDTALAYRKFAEKPNSVVEEIKLYIGKHVGDDLTRNSLAETVYLNPDYLARLFKKETGVPLGNYIIETRIQMAKHWLTTTQMPVHMVAGKVGYANDSYFSRLFKQECGLTPYEYRHRQQKDRLG
ncbi:response regulator [Paenibacillus sp. XY044]|uniref:response regulator transcription factor n=1 Tax=Paenibacillus sp. XY044 TaxID=2026089 RepID=UPI000B98BFF6|nr:response regulator [Paenibacillus sp. XY044]OZB98521.1 DNA-binding response regulator [Paenibacillus sp. XY044]